MAGGPPKSRESGDAGCEGAWCRVRGGRVKRDVPGGVGVGGSKVPVFKNPPSGPGGVKVAGILDPEIVGIP